MKGMLLLWISGLVPELFQQCQVKLVAECISATCLELCVPGKSLCVTSYLFSLARKCATPAPIDRPSSMLPPAAFLLQARLCASFSLSSIRTSIFSFCSAPDFPSHPLLQPSVPPASLQPCPCLSHHFSSVFPGERLLKLSTC